MVLMRIFFQSLVCLALVSCRTTSPRAVADIRSGSVDDRAKIAEAVAGLVDLYAFPSPSRPNHMVLALTVKPLSKDLPYFSEQVNYLFYVREGKINSPGQTAKIETRERGEKTIMCWFKTPKDPSRHMGTCALQNLGEVSAPFGDKQVEGDVWFYHGLRKDPFAFDQKLATRLAKASKKKSAEKSPPLTPQNVLSLVLDFDPQKLFGRDVKLVAVAAQSYTTSNDGRLKPLNRVGRPDIANVMLASNKSDDDLRSRYLLERPFEISEADKLRYKDRISEQVARYDQVDQQTDWNDQDRQAFTDMILEDYLVMDLTKFKSEAKYLAIEPALLAGKEHKSFGGRGIHEDAINRFFSLLISKGRDSVQSEEAGAGTKRPVKNPAEFPYLAEPDPKWSGSDAAYRARLHLGL